MSFVNVIIFVMINNGLNKTVHKYVISNPSYNNLVKIKVRYVDVELLIFV